MPAWFGYIICYIIRGKKSSYVSTQHDVWFRNWELYIHLSFSLLCKLWLFQRGLRVTGGYIDRTLLTISCSSPIARVTFRDLTGQTPIALAEQQIYLRQLYDQPSRLT